MSYPPQQPPITPGYPPQPRKRRGWTIALCVLIGIAAFALGAAAKVVYRTYGPGAAPDSGVQACKQLRDTPINQKGKQPLTEKRYRDLRDKFQGSHDAAIRDNGTKLVDLAWQIGQDESKALVYMGPLMTAVTGLQTACANQGVTLPAN